MILKLITFSANVWRLILFSVSLHCDSQKDGKMKYKELEKMVKKAGCYDMGRQMAGHPLWYSPKTGLSFQMSNHGSEEVATGTLNKILKRAGLK